MSEEGRTATEFGDARRAMLRDAAGCYARYDSDDFALHLHGFVQDVTDDGMLRMLADFGGRDGGLASVRLPLDGDARITLYGAWRRNGDGR